MSPLGEPVRLELAVGDGVCRIDDAGIGVRLSIDAVISRDVVMGLQVVIVVPSEQVVRCLTAVDVVIAVASVDRGGDLKKHET